MDKSQKQKQMDLRAQKNRLHSLHGKIISSHQEQWEWDDGQSFTIDIVEHPGAVAIIPVDDKGRLIFVRQWRRAAQKILIEFPAGTLEKGEEPLICANRELQEEIGMKAGRLIGLGGFYTVPGFCTEYIHLFVAKDLSPSILWADDTDFIDVLSLSFTEALEEVQRGAIIDAKTVAGLLLYQIHGLS